MNRELLKLPPTPDAWLLAEWFGTSMLPTEANAGLVFDRYFRIWKPEGGKYGEPGLLRAEKPYNPSPKPNESRANPMGDFVEDYNARKPDASLTAHHDRIRRVIDGSGMPNATLTLTTVSRLAIGLGGAHPTENSLTFDHLLGVPYLPGSSIKGACRAWSEIEVDGSRIDADRVQSLFGSAPRSGSQTAKAAERGGVLQFLAAHPRRRPDLAVEIVNNHHMKYYGASASHRAKAEWTIEPLDIESPNPVFFLVIEAQVPFEFHVLATDGEISTRDEGLKILEDALKFIGIGAKTSVGYGRFARQEP